MMLQDTTTQLVQDAAASSEAIRTAPRTWQGLNFYKFGSLDLLNY
jgi:hypothetical protein